MWVWLIYPDLGAAFLGLGEMKHRASGERKYLREKDLVDDLEAMMTITIAIGDKNVHDDVETATLTAAGAAVANWNAIVGNAVQIGADAMTGSARFMVMIEISLGALVDLLGAEAQRLLGVSLVTMNYESTEDWIKRVLVITLLLQRLHRQHL